MAVAHSVLGNIINGKNYFQKTIQIMTILILYFVIAMLAWAFICWVFISPPKGDIDYPVLISFIMGSMWPIIIVMVLIDMIHRFITKVILPRL